MNKYENQRHVASEADITDKTDDSTECYNHESGVSNLL